jgi:hypothetical protein
MPLFLAGLLVRGGAVAPDVMEEALQRQVLYGGALDTNLLEIGAADESTLAPYLARASGLPLAPAEAFEPVDARVRRTFPARLAERHGIIPFRVEGRTLDVACCYPVEASLIDEISFMLSLILRPHVAPEFRVRLSMERMYGLPAAQRFHALARRAGMEPPSPEEPAPDGHANEAAARSEQQTTAARSVVPGWSRDEALALLQGASDRDEAIEIVLRFGRRVFEYASAFVVVGGNLIGWDAIGPTTDARRRAQQVALPVEAPSILRTVVETGGRFLGPIPADEHHAALLEGLGRRAPRSAYLQPVSIGDRVVAVVLCDNGEKVVSPVQVSQVMVVVQALSSALEAMIRTRKGQLAEHAGEPEPPEVVALPPPPPARTPPPLPAATPVRAPQRARAHPPPPPPPRSENVRRAVEALLAARTDAERESVLPTLHLHAAAAAEMLVALLPSTAPDNLTARAAENPGSPAVQALLDLGDAALPALLRARKASAPGVRFWVALLLRHSRSRQAREALEALAVDPVAAVALLARGS